MKQKSLSDKANRKRNLEKYVDGVAKACGDMIAAMGEVNDDEEDDLPIGGVAKKAVHIYKDSCSIRTSWPAGLCSAAAPVLNPEVIPAVDPAVIYLFLRGRAAVPPTGWRRSRRRRACSRTSAPATSRRLRSSRC